LIFIFLNQTLLLYPKTNKISALIKNTTTWSTRHLKSRPLIRNQTIYSKQVLYYIIPKFYLASMNQCIILTGNQLIVIYSYKYDVKLIDEDHKIINIYLIYLEANIYPH